VPRAGLNPSDAMGAVAWHTALAGWLELDDHLLRGRPCAAIAAAGWASAGTASLEQLLAATVAGNEVAGRVGLATVLGADSWGCPPATAAGVAVTAGLLAGLDEPALCHAVGLALSAPSTSIARTPDVPAVISHARAAEAGMRAVLQARSGEQTSLDLLDRADGFLSSLSWRPLLGALSGMGTAWLTDTISHRRFACAPAGVTAVDSVAEILARHVKAADKRLRVDQVERIEVYGPGVLASMAASGPLLPSALPWALPELLGLLVARHDLSAADLSPDVLRAQADGIRRVADRVEVFVQPSRTAEALTAQLDVLGPLLAELGWRDARRELRHLSGSADRFGGQGRGGEGLRAVLRLVRSAAGLRALTAGQLQDVDVASWQLHLPVEVQLYTTRGGRWPERRLLPDGSPGADWTQTQQLVHRRFDGTDQESAAYQMSEAASDAMALPLLAPLLPQR